MKLGAWFLLSFKSIISIFWSVQERGESYYSPVADVLMIHRSAGILGAAKTEQTTRIQNKIYRPLI